MYMLEGGDQTLDSSLFYAKGIGESDLRCDVFVGRKVLGICVLNIELYFVSLMVLGVFIFNPVTRSGDFSWGTKHPGFYTRARNISKNPAPWAGWPQCTGSTGMYWNVLERNLYWKIYWKSVISVLEKHVYWKNDFKKGNVLECTGKLMNMP